MTLALEVVHKIEYLYSTLDYLPIKNIEIVVKGSIIDANLKKALEEYLNNRKTNG